MATTHVFAVGRIQDGLVDILLAPRRQQSVCDDSHGCICYAYSHGYDDAKAGYLPEPLHHVSALCCIDRYMAGHRDACTVNQAQAALPLPDGALQRLIDEGQMTAEYEDYLADVEFFRHGC